MERNVNLYLFNIFLYSTNNFKIDLNKHFIEFFRDYFANIEFTHEKDCTVRFFLILIQSFIENTKKFDEKLLSAWQEEIKPFILDKYPLIKQNSFIVNSDFNFFIEIIDSLKDQYAKPIEKAKEEKMSNEENNNINKVEKNDIKPDMSEGDKNFEERQHRSIGVFSKKKGKGDWGINIHKKCSNNINYIGNGNEHDKKFISKIDKLLKEFILKNIKEKKRNNSMVNLRPHSQTITSETTNDSSTIEENLNINQLISNNNKDLSLNNNNNKKTKDIYSNILNDNKENKKENYQKEKTLVKSKSIALLREMTPFFRDEGPIEGKTIIYKQSENKLTHIFPDVMLQKIIKEDFMNKNALLIYHFCQQCFCFVNKEIFFRKIFHCYKFYKTNTSKKKLANLIEFINVLIIEMFRYYQKINLEEVHVKIIKKFYGELITDLISSLDNVDCEKENENNSSSDSDEENYEHNFRFESIDYYNNESNINTNKTNYNYMLNKKSLINMNLNIEIKNINIFIYKEKDEKEKEQTGKNNPDKKDNKKQLSPLSSKSIPKLTLSPKLQNKQLLLLDDKIDKNYKSQEINCILVGNNDKNENSIESKEDKEYAVNLNINEFLNEQSNEKGEEKMEKRQKSFQLTRTLRKSEVISLKRLISNDAIIVEEDDDQKQKSDEDEKDKDLSSSDSSDIEEDNKSCLSNDNDNDKGNEIDLQLINAYSCKNIINSKKFTKEMLEDKLVENKENEKKKKEEEQKEILELIKNMKESADISEENIISINEKILNQLKFILNLFEDNQGEPSFQELKEAKDNINFYKNLKIIKVKNKKKYIFPIQKQKRSTYIFGIGTMSIKPKLNTRDYLRKGYFCVLDWPIEDIGDQLMKISKSLINKINPRELYRAIYLKKDKDITSPNVVQCITKCNRITSFIIEDILSYDFPKDRAKVYERWVLIAEYCLSIKDYNDVIGIYSALNHYVITGLNLTLKEVKHKTNMILKKISEFCSCLGNYRNIREDMNNCEKTGEVFVPYLGMLLRDINFFEESSKYFNQNGCINFEKIEKVTQLLEKNFTFRNAREKNYRIKELDFLEELEDITEQQLEEMANKLEPEFKMEGSPKPTKRLTNTDKKYFEKYTKRTSIAK